MPPAMKRRHVTLAAAGSLVLCLATLSLWFLTICGWGRWTALQGPNRSYVATIAHGQLCLQIADVSPDRQRPATFRWRWVGGRALDDKIGVVSDPSIWSGVGLIRTVEYVPYSDGILDRGLMPPLMTRPAFCRNFVLPFWLVALITAYLPLRWYLKGTMPQL
jgi:hypothetical protein